MPHSNAGNRLDRLPIARLHKFILFAVSFAYFFEFADINTFAVVAPQLIKTWGISLDTVAYITSLTFLGMFLGSIVGGRLADKVGRRKALILSVSFFSVFSLLNAASWDAVSLGSYVASLISDRAERRWTLTLTGMLIAASGLLYGMTFQPAFIVIFGLSVNCFERTYTSLAYAYSPELFPAEARATGTSVPYGIGRLSNIAGPIIISTLFTGYGYLSVFVFIAGTWLVGSLTLGIFGSSTRKRSMDIFDEVGPSAGGADLLKAA